MNIKNFAMACLVSLAVVGCAGGMGDGCCGWSGREVSATGQVKSVGYETNIVCPGYYIVSISLGVMRNGVGSMSTHDMAFFIPDGMVKDFRTAAEKSSIVNFTYDVRRSANCVIQDRITSFKVAE